MRWEQMGDKSRHLFALERLLNREDLIVEDYVTIIGDVKIGKGCHLKSHSCIGSKGFSFGFDDDGLPTPIRHEGGVRLGDYVEVGVHSHIACATMKGVDTVLEDYVKLDDSVHIAHNCIIKKGAILTAGVITGGGVIIGERAWIGLGAKIKNKVKVGNYALVGVGSVVIEDVPDGVVVKGCPAKIIRMRNHE